MALGFTRPPGLEAASSKTDFTVRIAPISVELAPGRTVQTIAYNGRVPGPVLRMREGRRIGVDIFNDKDVAELVHWHGQNVSAEADGAEEEGSPLVPPHGHLRVSFVPAAAGTR
jgi:FtsP/CotA-like multicopper oxidase with cupredoxin domain